MTDDKKPKIDLKSRLQKISGPAPAPGGAPSSPAGPLPSVPPPPSAPFGVNAAPSVPPMAGPPGLSAPPRAVPMPPPVGSAPPPAMGSQPAPTGPRTAPPPAVAPGGAMPMGGRGPGAVPMPAPLPMANAFATTSSPEDEAAALENVRRDTRKKGYILAALVGVVFAGLGVAGGKSMEARDAHNRSIKDATELAAGVDGTKQKMTELATTVEEGAKQLRSGQFPAALETALVRIDFDFDGSKLAGRRFTAVSAETTRDLYDFISRVQYLKHEQKSVAGVLGALKKPLQDQFEAAKKGQETVRLGFIVDKNATTMGGILAKLVEPVTVTENTQFPAQMEFEKRVKGQAVKFALPRYVGTTMAKDGMIVPVMPSSFTAVCPDAASGGLAQLVSNMTNLVKEIRGEKSSNGDIVTEGKAGLIETADKVSLALRNAANKAEGLPIEKAAAPVAAPAAK